MVENLQISFPFRLIQTRRFSKKSCDKLVLQLLNTYQHIIVEYYFVHLHL